MEKQDKKMFPNLKQSRGLWPEAQLLTPSEAASLLRVSRSTVYRLIEAGELGSLRIGASRRIPMAAIAALTHRAGVA